MGTFLDKILNSYISYAYKFIILRFHNFSLSHVVHTLMSLCLRQKTRGSDFLFPSVTTVLIETISFMALGFIGKETRRQTNIAGKKIKIGPLSNQNRTVF